MTNLAYKKRIQEEETDTPAATDGNITNYTGSSGFTGFSWPGTLTVDLQETYILKVIRFLLWDNLGTGGTQRAGRIYKYRLLTSLDHKTWNVIFDTGSQGYDGWQVFELPQPIEARYIRIHGMWNSANEAFHVVQIEAHDTDPPPLQAEIRLQKTVLLDTTGTEVRDGLPLESRVRGIITGIEKEVLKSDLLNPKPFKELITQLRLQVSDIGAIERSMEAVRREIIRPVRGELERLSQAGRFSKWSFWVGIAGGIVAIISIILVIADRLSWI